MTPLIDRHNRNLHRKRIYIEPFYLKLFTSFQCRFYSLGQTERTHRYYVPAPIIRQLYPTQQTFEQGRL